MKLYSLISILVALIAPAASNAIATANPRGQPQVNLDAASGPHPPPPQQLVTWDDRSLMIRDERVMIFSGEVHPFRLPVPSLYTDIFEKIKALGLNTVSFYVDWALLEGKPGEVRDGGIFDLDAFFDAANKTGMYLLARPGPYINAEVSGGGFPGWLQRIKGVLRTDAPDFVNATLSYTAAITKKIAKAQITNGGPVILYQPENELTTGLGGKMLPNYRYMQHVIDQARNAGIVVPMINNDAFPWGSSVPGSGPGSVDIYGYDAYPLGFACGQMHSRFVGSLPMTMRQQHLEISPKTPLSLIEFQGGSWDSFGGEGFEKCSMLTDQAFERVFYKNNLAAGVAIFNIYMIYGGTNWGNLGHPGGYTSYDYGASIREDRTIDREKYSELKLQGQFIKVSPGYLLATPGNATQGVYSDNKNITITPLLDKHSGSFFVVRQTAWMSTASVSYRVELPTAAGNLSIPQLSGSLSLHGFDSKIHVTDYPMGDWTLLYSTGEIFTWKQFADKTVLILYGGPNELHELAVTRLFNGEFDVGIEVLEGDGVIAQTSDEEMLIIQWGTSPSRTIVRCGDLDIYLLDRHDAYKYWVPTLPGEGEQSAYGSSLMNPDAVIVNGGYLVRSVSIQGSTLALRADFNDSTTIEIIGVPDCVTKLMVNNETLVFRVSPLGNWVTELPEVGLLDLRVPLLSELDWKRVDSLPEIQKGYDDSLWPLADHKSSENSLVPLKTHVSLYGSDYGFHTGTLLFRGYFTAPAADLKLKLATQGGTAFASSVWLNDTFVGSFKGVKNVANDTTNYKLAKLVKGNKYVLTIVVDSTGLNQNFFPGLDDMKEPRGILNYSLSIKGGTEVPISPWKITGNLGGESYRDKIRGPLNEGGLFFERKGYHLPGATHSSSDFTSGSPMDGIPRAGIAFFSANLTLDLPAKWFDIPLSFVFSTPEGSAPYRALLYVNGFQYGKYISNIGPQTEFPVPEGILDHHGENWIGMGLWALEDRGAKVPDLQLKFHSPIMTGRDEVKLVEGLKLKDGSLGDGRGGQSGEREGAY